MRQGGQSSEQPTNGTPHHILDAIDDYRAEVARIGVDHVRNEIVAACRRLWDEASGNFRVPAVELRELIPLAEEMGIDPAPEWEPMARAALAIGSIEVALLDSDRSTPTHKLDIGDSRLIYSMTALSELDISEPHDRVWRAVGLWLGGRAWWAYRVPSKQLVPVLDDVGTAESATLLEPFIGALQRQLDDPAVAFEEFDEAFIRSQVEAIRGWHRSGAAVPAQVTAAIGLIVGRLQEIGHTEADIDAIRRRLEELQPEPESITDEIIRRFERAIDQIADLGSYPDITDLVLPAKALAEAVDQIHEAARQVEANTDYSDLIKEEAAKSIGKEAGPMLAWMTKAGVKTAVGAPILIELFKQLDKLLKLYSGF